MSEESQQRPQPQGKLGRQGPGPGDEGAGGAFTGGGRALALQAPRRHTLATGSGEEGLALGTPLPAAWKVGRDWRGRLVSIKMFLPGEPLEAEIPRDFHSFPYLPL